MVLMTRESARFHRHDSIDTGMLFALRYWQAAATFVVFEAKPWLCQGLSQIWANGRHHPLASEVCCRLVIRYWDYGAHREFTSKPT